MNLTRDYPLHAAALWGATGKMEQLIGEGKDVNAKNDEYLTPLSVAAKKGHLKAVQILLGSGAKVHLTDKQGNSPLHFAARVGHEEVVRELLAKCAKEDKDVITAKNLEGGHFSAVDLVPEGDKYDSIRALFKEYALKETEADSGEGVGSGDTGAERWDDNEDLPQRSQAAGVGEDADAKRRESKKVSHEPPGSVSQLSDFDRADNDALRRRYATMLPTQEKFDSFSKNTPTK